MIEQKIFTRGGKSYTAYRGIDEDGIGVAYIEANFTEKGQTIRYIPELTRISVNWQGRYQPIKVQWKRFLLTNEGTPIENHSAPLLVTLNGRDMQDITNAYFGVFSSMYINGIRSMNGANGFGFNYQPLIDEAGEWISDDMYDTSLPPTNDYDTHHSDGTPLTAPDPDKIV